MQKQNRSRGAKVESTADTSVQQDTRGQAEGFKGKWDLEMDVRRHKYRLKYKSYHFVPFREGGNLASTIL